MKSHILFPNRYKKIGLIIIILSILIPIAWHFLSPSTFPDKNLVKKLMKLFVFTGFTFLIFSKEKVEDEFITIGRLRAGAISFFTIITLIILRLFVSLFTDSFAQSTESIILQQCIFYLVFFQLYKSGSWTFKSK